MTSPRIVIMLCLFAGLVLSLLSRSLPIDADSTTSICPSGPLTRRGSCPGSSGSGTWPSVTPQLTAPPATTTSVAKPTWPPTSTLQTVASPTPMLGTQPQVLPAVSPTQGTKLWPTSPPSPNPTNTP